MNKGAIPWSRLTAATLVLGLAAGGYWFWQQRSEAPAAERYRTQPVTRGALIQSVSANGTLNPVVLVSVGTQVSGTVQKLHVDFNQRVEAGQVLAELDPALLRAAEQQTLASLGGAQAALRLAQSNEERLRQLFAQEYISRQEFDQGIQAREAAEAQVRLYEAQLARDRTNLRYTVIRSPVSGVVVDRQVNVGQTVAASFQTPTLFLIAQDLKQMQIDTSVAEADVGSIRVGQKVEFRVDAFPEQVFSGAVKQIRLNPKIETNVVTYNVVVSVANPEETLLPGMTAYITVITEVRDSVLMVPNAALRFRPAQSGAAQPARSGPQIHVLRGNAIVPVAIQPGLSNGRMTEVAGGELREGDPVVIDDLQLAPAGRAGTGSPRTRLF